LDAFLTESYFHDTYFVLSLPYSSIHNKYKWNELSSHSTSALYFESLLIEALSGVFNSTKTDRSGEASQSELLFIDQEVKLQTRLLESVPLLWLESFYQLAQGTL